MSRIHVVKIGGSVAEDEQKLHDLLDDFVSLSGQKLLVHGGGVIATEMAERLGLQTKMIDGRRVTDEAMLEVTTMVYAGLVNKKIVAKLQQRDANAVGLTGADLNIIRSRKRPAEPVDFGWVGDVEDVHIQWIQVFMEQGVIPVVAPLTHDGNGHMLNTNADTIASSLAASLSRHAVVNLYFLFDRPGVILEDEVIREMTPKKYRELREKGVIKDGMIPKLDLGFSALELGVHSVVLKEFNALPDEEKGTRLNNE